MPDYSIYKYYKGPKVKLTGKAAFFGWYEQLFDDNYTGMPEGKEDAFKDYMTNLFYEKASDSAGMSNITSGMIREAYDDILKQYFDEDYMKEAYSS